MEDGSQPGQSLSSQKGRRLGSATKRKRGRSGRAARSERVGSRRASSMRWLFVLFAGGLAAAILLVLSDTDDAIYVARFSSEVPALSLVGGASIEAAPMPISAIEPGTFSGSDPSAVLAEASDFAAGRWLAVQAGEKQQLRRSMFTSAGELAIPLAPDERLISISSTAPRALAGRIRAGDRVDVYVAAPGGVTGLLASDVEVVAVSVPPAQFDTISSQQLSRPRDSFEDIAPRDPVPGTYVMRVHSSRAGDFVAADSSGRIYLILRGPGAGDSSSDPKSIDQVICSSAPRSPACEGVVDPALFEQQPQSGPPLRPGEFVVVPGDAPAAPTEQ